MRNRTLTNGVNTWTISPLKPGTYTLNVKYNGDGNYLASKNSTKIISKSYPSIDIQVNEAFVGDDYKVSVALNSTATGTVLIDVDGVKYNKTLKGGKTSLDLKNLTAGKHTVKVTYSGDANFYNASASKSFEPKTLSSSVIVTASDIEYGNDLTVKATVTSGATGKVEFTVNGVTKSSEIKNGVATVKFDNLNAGNYKVNAKYLGNKEYISSSNSTNVKVSKAKSFVSIDVGEIKEGENVAIKFTVPKDATGVISVEIPGLYSLRNRTLTNGVNTWTISPLKSGVYTLKVTYNGDGNYLTSKNSTEIVSKYHPDIKIDVSDSTVGEDVTVKVSLKNDATGKVIITVDNAKYEKTLSNGQASVVISGITKGKHNVNVEYSGDKYYYPAKNSTAFTPKLNSNIKVATSDISFGDDLTVSATVNKDATGKVIFTLNGKNKTAEVKNGLASTTFTRPDAATYQIRALYTGDDVYASSSNATTAKVSKINSTLSITVGKIEEGKNVAIKITASKYATGNITLEIPGLYSKRTKTLYNNEYTWTIAPLSAGLYNVNVDYAGDNNYYPSSASTVIDYNRVKTSLSVDAIPQKNNVRLVANITSDDGQLITAWVNVDVNGTAYRIPVFNGTGYLDLGKLDGGIYKYSAVYAGTKAIINSTDDGEFEVIPVEAILEVPDVIKYYKGSERLQITLKDNYGDAIVNASITVTINGYDYSRTSNENGTASIALSLNSGNYSVPVKADTYLGSLETVANVTILPTVNATDIVKVFRNGTQYYATFRDSNGNYLAEGTVVTFNIHGVFYERAVKEKGLAKLNLNLEQGTYILTATNPVTGENAANTITVISKLVDNHDITKYYRNATQYTLRVIADNGKTAGAGEKVTFNINGVFYTRTTNESGMVKLNINLEPGTYVITAEYGGCRVSNTVKVLPVLSAKDLTKKYGTSDQFVATLLDGQGRPFEGEKILFNINGVFYNRTTDSEGHAKLNIRLQAGEYIITSSYNGVNIANKVTITA